MRPLTAVLIAISVVGVIGLPLGDPKFLAVGLVLEVGFIALSILSIIRIRFVMIPSLVIASFIIIGNTISPNHTEIMLTMDPLYNAIVLIVGGYVLQAFLIVTTIIERNKMKYLARERVGGI